MTAKLILRYAALTLTLVVFLGGCSRQSPPHHDSGGITVPEGFRAQVIADKIGRARQIAVRENGDLYLCLMDPVDLGYVVALRDSDGDGLMDIVKYFGELDSMCKSLQLYKGYLYVGTTTQIVRFPLSDDELLPTGPYQVVVSGFPEPKSHRSKNITFDDSGNLYVSAGAPSNSCQEVDRTEASPGKLPCDELDRYSGVWMFDAEELGQTQEADGFHFATGIRNDVAFQWDPVKKELYGVQNGRDSLHQNWGHLFNERQSAELPSEEFQLIRQGSDFGWPYTYYDHEQGSRIVNPEYGGDGVKRPEEGLYEDPILAFPGHWAPVGLQFYNGQQFPEKYRGGAFVAFHGSWNRAPLPQQGYNVVYVPFSGKYPSGSYEVFADGFKGKEVLLTPREATHRPTGLAVGPDGSLYVSEDTSGRVWKITYTGEKSAAPTNAASAPSRDSTSKIASANTIEAARLDPQGEALYSQYCLPCHQIDGSGVPGMQPSLIEASRLQGNDEFLVKLMLQGSEWIQERQYTNLMTSFATLSDDEIATVLNYVKVHFGKTTPTIVAADVAKARSAAIN